MIYAIEMDTKEHRVIRFTSELPEGRWVIKTVEPDGWIPWEGGECPLPYGVKHEVKFSNRTSVDFNPETWNWNDDTRPIIAYRPILDAKPEAPAWDGEGLPPVGVECELKRGPEWVRVKITGKGERVTVFRRLCNVALEEITEAEADEFRPIRSEEGKAVEGMAKALEQNHGSPCSMYHGYCRTLFRLGYRKEAGNG